MRTPFQNFAGIAAAMPQANINTDAIIPSRFLRTATADLSKGLFGEMRYEGAGGERADFVLNMPPFRDAQILVADENFGCGSSREAAVWALAQFGIRAVFAPSFADIFYENAFRNGMLAGIVDRTAFGALADEIAEHRQVPVFAVDLLRGTITGPNAHAHEFSVPRSRADALIRGDDDIAVTLRHADDIDAFYAAASNEKAWLYRSAARGLES